jgi:very-short-patch-repair endonuclease/uncharacterized small protein (DUF1192 family)
MQASHDLVSNKTRSQLIQIFRYVQALDELRNPPQKEINDQPWTMWFHDLPIHPNVRLGVIATASDTDEEVGDDFFFKVSRPKLIEAPIPPVEITPWLEDGWQYINGKVGVRPTVNKNVNGQVQTIQVNDNPQRKSLLDEWIARREKWVATETPTYHVMDIYERLYALIPIIEREGERIELMVGDGLVTWRHKSGNFIHHPVMLLHVQLLFNPNIPEFTLTETGQSAELYTNIFQSIPDLSANQIARCREDLEQGGWHPLGGEETSRFMKRLISQLSPFGELTEEGILQRNNVAPTIVRDPILFLRPRNLGMHAALNAILENLPHSDELSNALTSLVKVDADNLEAGTPAILDSLSINRTLDAPNGEDEIILLSKPANAEQLEIARRLDRDAAVLVQGPPGTGKTHTIANLIGHLLAQGKSVLVTSEKPKALRVLKDKVVEPLQPLCVSILGDDSRKEMESTIDAISERLAFTDANKLEREAATLAQDRSSLLRQLRETRQKLVEARGSEYRAITIAGETFSPSEAARYILQKKTSSGWIPDPVVSGTSLPLTKSELAELYMSNVAITSQEEREIGLLLPESGQLLSPVDFERLVAEQVQMRKVNLSYRHDLWSRINTGSSPEIIEQLLHRLNQEVEILRNLTNLNAAVMIAGREGGPYRQVWEDLLLEVERTYSLAAQAQLWLLKYDPAIALDCLSGRLEKVLDDIIEYLKQGGKLNGFKLLTNRDWKTLIESSTVQGKAPEVVEHFVALRYFVQLRSARSNLVGRWQRQVTASGGPDGTSCGPYPEITFRQNVAALRYYLDWYKSTWQPLETELKNQGFQWERLLAEMPVNHVQYDAILRLRIAVVEHLPVIINAEVLRRKFTQIEHTFLTLERHLDQLGPGNTKAEIVYRLSDAVKQRNASAYRVAYESLNTLHTKSETLRLRRALLTRLEKAAPSWAYAIRERNGVHGERTLPGDPQEAWLWRQLQDELDQRTKLSLEELQERIVQLNEKLFRITAELVEKKAWAAQVRRTTLEQRRALQGWRELMRKVGKGKGKRAPRLLAEARKLMPTCQAAVPVWIMPLSYVTTNFDMKRNHFDVVIVDEASQADINALVAVYLGKQVLVVGDDEQVSPLAVGQNLDDIQRLIDTHLRGIPLANIYDGKLSIYSLARTTFTPVCLLEHFRCVSPIIQFSNELSYHGKIKPLRDDSEVKIRPATVAYSVKSFSKRGKVNEEEANTVASLLIAAAEQPEYENATFGVISMVGIDQALCIEELLRRNMPATDYIRRRILCGDPAQFQGDERDVMFLSMVDTPGDSGGPLSLRAEEGHDEMFKKRFNVAASRARDQMWVVHSLDPENDLKPGDIRRRLILHARDQHARNNEIKLQEQKIESPFEKQVFDRLVRAGYRVKTQWPVGAYRIDMVVEGNGKRLAIECDGDRWHTQDRLEEDMVRQAILERLGWRFVRIRGSQFFRGPDNSMQPVFVRLQDLDIPPEGMVTKKSEDSDGKELKARIIRRAEELRQQWKESTGTRISTVDVKQRGYQVESIDKTSDISSKPQAAAPMAKGIDSFNVVLFFQTRGIKIIDNRGQNGGIWVEGGNELSSAMQTLAAKGIHFKFVPGGIPYNSAAGRYYRDGWFAKSI